MTALIEGFYVVRILDALSRIGVLDRLDSGATVPDLCDEFGLLPERIAPLLEYLSLRSDVVRKTAEGFAVDADDPETQFALHLLDQYAGAYGPCLSQLPDILSGDADGRALVDLSRHARAFARADRYQADPDILRLLGELGVTSFVDLGCGTAGLMIEHALGHQGSRCIGVDASAPAIAEARRRIAENGLSDRVRVVEGDVCRIADLVAADDRDSVQCLVATSVANAFFGEPGGTAIDAWFSALRRAFPGRIMILGDYFGSLGHPLQDPAALARGLFHDVAQVLSGQGIPPGDLDEWAKLLDRNGCTLIKAFEGEGGDMRRFILLLQL